MQASWRCPLVDFYCGLACDIQIDWYIVLCIMYLPIS